MTKWQRAEDADTEHCVISSPTWHITQAVCPEPPGWFEDADFSDGVLAAIFSLVLLLILAALAFAAFDSFADSVADRVAKKLGKKGAAK